MTELQQEVLTIIKGRDSSNPITGAEIIVRCRGYQEDNKKKGANMRSIINALRKKDCPICSSGNGYFYPRTPFEVDKTIGSIEGRIASMKQVIAGLNNGRHNIELQSRISNMKQGGRL